MPCLSIGRRVPLMDRFWPKVNKDGPVIRPEFGNCWLWIGTLHNHGYGRIDAGVDSDSRYLYAHRIAWEQASGETLVTEDDVCHVCDTPACVRNDDVGTYIVRGKTVVRYGHLFKADQVINNADRDDKGRVQRGELNGMAIMTEREAMRAADLYTSGSLTVREIALILKVSPAAIGDLVNGKTWRHITGGSLKGRGRDGRVKLTAEERNAIRTATGVTQAELARRYGVDQGYVSQLRSGKR